MTSARPVKTDSGMPLATAFEKQARIRCHAELLLRAAERQPESGPHLVEDQQRAARSAELLDLLEKSPRGGSKTVGSRITQAMSSSRAASSAARLL